MTAAVVEQGVIDATRAQVFALGTHEPAWSRLTDVPTLCIARQRLTRRKAGRPRRAGTDVLLDGGGFTELQYHGRWRSTPEEYAAEVGGLVEVLGRVVWCAPQDYMCEPAVIEGGTFGRLSFVGTGLSRREHIERTVQNALDLRALRPDLPWLYVVQGYAIDDYLLCLDLYRSAGVDLTAQPIVGIGSVCRRQATAEIHDVFAEMVRAGLRCHGFGVKTLGFERYAHLLSGADSTAWSDRARYHAQHAAPGVDTRMPGCTSTAHRSCANCLTWATSWHRSRRWLTPA